MKPNVFIVGAPKCGTTALSFYLSGHPNVFMSTPKEPDYFCKDFPLKRHMSTVDDYLSLFSNAGTVHSAVGEASVWYLYSNVAAKELKAFCPDARIIVMLRNPVDVVYSLHSQLLWTLDEDVEDFNKAWEMQAIRSKGNSIPVKCTEPAFLQYRKVAMFGEQIERLYRSFDRDQVFILWFDEFIKSPADSYRSVLTFLSLKDDERTGFPVINGNKGHHSHFLAGFTQRPPALAISVMQFAKRMSGIQKFGMLERIRSINNRKFKRSPLQKEFRQVIINELVDDVALLEDITGRNLNSWKQ